MNCCDGNCRQGRDCPLRKEVAWSNKETYAIIILALLCFWWLFGLIMFFFVA